MKLIFTIITICVTALTGAVKYVDVNATGTNNGISWNNAYTNLQSALDTAVSGDEIWVAAGTYYPSVEVNGSGDRFKAYQMINGVTIYGGFAGNESALDQRTDFGNGGSNETILSGDIGIPGDNSDNCYHVFNHPDPGAGQLSADATAILDGFTIAYGNANGTEYRDQSGGGINSHRGNPTLRNLILKSNSSSRSGAGLFCYVSSSNLSNLTFIENEAGLSGGGMYTNYCDGMTAKDIEFISNVSGQYGGGLYNYYSSQTYNNVKFIANTAQGGGGLFSNNSNSVFNNALFYENESYYPTTMDGSGGAIYNYNSNPTFNNATIVYNSASNTGGGLQGNCVLNNCIIWGNSAVGQGNQIYSTGTITINYSCYSNGTGDVQGYGTTTPSNCINTDPRLVDISANDYRIFGDSPSVNSGLNSYNSKSYDIRGQDRIQNTTIDMGAYEWTSGIDPMYILAPSDLTIIRNETSTQLSWSAVDGAATYQIYRSEDPYGTFSLIDTVMTLTYTDSEVLSGNKYFYYVIAVSESK